MSKKPTSNPITPMTTAAGLQLQAVAELGKLNPFTVADDVISQHIIGIHDSQAIKQDVDSLYKVVANIVKSSSHVGHSLDLKRFKSADLVEDKVSGFIPAFSTLKEIACQMTCKSFNTSTAHESIVGILEKLRSYSWDVKAVIALTAFTLVYGETWRLSLMQASKGNALELHIFKLGELDNLSQDNADLISTLVDNTLQLIEGITKLEKMANKGYMPKDVPTLYKAPRDLYTYWAILALLACANRMTELERNIKSEVVARLKLVSKQLYDDLAEINCQIERLEDLIWRFVVFRTPSGILELLKALIFPKDIKQLEFFDNTAKELVNLEVLRTKNLLLFISGLDNIKDEIWVLISIHESLTKDKDKQDYKILWIPVVEEWNAEEKKKFEDLKSQMPWYVLQYFSVIKGIKPLQEEWNYPGKPIVVVTNHRGEVINKNALHLIFVWKIEAFPFGPEDEERLSQEWKWFWNKAVEIHPDTEKWIQEDKYVFFYGGTDIAWTQKFGELVDAMKNDSTIKEADVLIEQFNVGMVDQVKISKFWVNITYSFFSKIQKANYELDSVLPYIQTLLSMKNEKGWALLSKGEKVLVLGFNALMMNVLEEFERWKTNVSKLQGFDKAFMDYYNRRRSEVPLACIRFQLNNIHSGIPLNIYCSEPSCRHKMDVESVNYKCCHGKHYDDVTDG